MWHKAFQELKKLGSANFNPLKLKEYFEFVTRQHRFVELIDAALNDDISS